MASSGGRSVQRNVEWLHHSSYCVAFTEAITILNNKILKCIKLITINLQCCSINSNKIFKVSRSSYGRCLQLYGSCIQTSMSIVCRDLLLVERVQRVVSSGEALWILESLLLHRKRSAYFGVFKKKVLFTTSWDISRKHKLPYKPVLKKNNLNIEKTIRFSASSSRGVGILCKACYSYKSTDCVQPVRVASTTTGHIAVHASQATSIAVCKEIQLPFLAQV
jgi:hypothetical protein